MIMVLFQLRFVLVDIFIKLLVAYLASLPVRHGPVKHTSPRSVVVDFVHPALQGHRVEDWRFNSVKDKHLVRAPGWRPCDHPQTCRQ